MGQAYWCNTTSGQRCRKPTKPPFPHGKLLHAPPQDTTLSAQMLMNSVGDFNFSSVSMNPLAVSERISFTEMVKGNPRTHLSSWFSLSAKPYHLKRLNTRTSFYLVPLVENKSTTQRQLLPTERFKDLPNWDLVTTPRGPVYSAATNGNTPMTYAQLQDKPEIPATKPAILQMSINRQPKTTAHQDLLPKNLPSPYDI